MTYLTDTDKLQIEAVLQKDAVHRDMVMTGAAAVGVVLCAAGAAIAWAYVFIIATACLGTLAAVLVITTLWWMDSLATSAKELFKLNQQVKRDAMYALALAAKGD